MSSPFVAEIRIFGCNFAPTGWAQCNGQLMPISQNTALFSLLGTSYGGDGKSTFALPNMQGNAPMHAGQNPGGLSQRFLGEESGSPFVTLLATEMPVHSHTVKASSAAATAADPGGNFWAQAVGDQGGYPYYAANATTQMNPACFTTAGSSLPHNNMHPYLVLNFCIALQGVFPARN
jgi:microcystin-dependent protein